MGLNEADTCRVYVTPKLREAGWEKNPRSLTEQYTFTAGRVFVTGGTVRRGERQRADYLLRYTRDFPMAVVEAKPEGDPAGQGMQQAKKYAEILGLKFAYATNGHDILEFDYLTGQERTLSAFPTPDALFARLRSAEGLDIEAAERLLSPFHHLAGLTWRALSRAITSSLPSTAPCRPSCRAGPAR